MSKRLKCFWSLAFSSNAADVVCSTNWSDEATTASLRRQRIPAN